MTARKDRTGERFGKLTVLRELGGGKILCRCDCGNEKVINRSNVISGKVKSCGCASFGRRVIFKNTVGRKFARLTVIEELGKGKVLCKCDCGNEKIINKGHLLNGDIKSCGCLMRSSAENNKKPFLDNGTNIAKIMSSKASARSTSGIRGVYKGKTPGTWRAGIMVKGKNIDLGTFESIELAAAARKAAEEKYYKPLLEKWKKENNSKM